MLSWAFCMRQIDPDFKCERIPFSQRLLPQQETVGFDLAGVTANQIMLSWPLFLFSYCSLRRNGGSVPTSTYIVRHCINCLFSYHFQNCVTVHVLLWKSVREQQLRLKYLGVNVCPSHVSAAEISYTHVLIATDGCKLELIDLWLI